MSNCPLPGRLCVGKSCKWWFEPKDGSTNCILDLYPQVKEHVVKVFVDLQEQLKRKNDPESA